nr:hypothetical protein CFP56_53548 [Quercus suber]
MENLRNELAPNQTLSETSLHEKLNHRTYASPLHDVINFNHTPLTVENPSQPKWKRLIRESYGKAPTTNDQIGSKRPIDMVIDISESPCKKFLVMWNANPQWRWLLEMTGRSIKDIFKRAFEEKMDVALLAFTSGAMWNRRN